MKKLSVLLILILTIGLIAACASKERVITWEGVEELVVTAGDRVDLMKGVKAIDSVDGDISSDIVILNTDEHYEELEEQGFLDDYFEFDSSLAGHYIIFYRVHNSAGEKSYAERDVFVYPGHNVINGDFSRGTFGWTLDQPGGIAAFSVNSSKNGQVVIERAGTEWWSLQLMQGVTLKANETYKISIVARSPQQRSLSFSFEDTLDGFRMLMNGVVVQKLDTEFKEYVWYYTADKTYSSAKAVIYLGYQLDGDDVGSEPHVVELESVYIEKVEKSLDVTFNVPQNITLNNGDDTSFDLSEGVSATYNGNDVTGNIKVIGQLTQYIQSPTRYIITYALELEDNVVAFALRYVYIVFHRDNPYQVINHDFSMGFSAWTADVNQTAGSGKANFEVIDEGAKVTVINTSTARWHIQMYQSGLAFESGKTYNIKIKIKADQAREANIEVAKTQGGVTQIVKHEMEVTTEFQEFTLVWTPDKDYPAARIGFQCGNATVGPDEPAEFIIEYFTVELQS